MRMKTIISVVVGVALLVAAFVFPALNYQNGWIKRAVWTADNDGGEVIGEATISKMELGGRYATPYVFFEQNGESAYATISKQDYGALNVGDTVYNVRCNIPYGEMVPITLCITLILLLILVLVSLKIQASRRYNYGYDYDYDY